jgi:hypothetical protein
MIATMANQGIVVALPIYAVEYIVVQLEENTQGASGDSGQNWKQSSELASDVGFTK